MTKRILSLGLICLLAACSTKSDSVGSKQPDGDSGVEDDTGTGDTDEDSRLDCIPEGELVNIQIDLSHPEADEMQGELFLKFEDGQTLQLNNGWAEIPNGMETKFFRVIDVEETVYPAEFVASITTAWVGDYDLQLTKLESSMFDMELACP